MKNNLTLFWPHDPRLAFLEAVIHNLQIIEDTGIEIFQIDFIEAELIEAIEFLISVEQLNFYDTSFVQVLNLKPILISAFLKLVAVFVMMHFLYLSN